MSDEGVKEEEKTTEEKTINEESSVEDILASRETEPKEEKPTSETVESDKSGEDVKTPEEDTSEESEEEGLAKEGEQIPYQRLNKVIEQRNDLRQEKENLQAEIEELRGESDLLTPEVLQFALSKKGLDETQIAEEFQKRNLGLPKIEEKPTQLQELVKDLDFNKQTDWLEAIKRISEATAKGLVKPVEQGLTQTQRAQQERVINQQLQEQKVDAEKLAKRFGLPYGDEAKDVGNPKTAVGKMMAYLKTLTPEEFQATAGLPKTRILALAMQGEGFKIGEQKGKEAEKNRQKKLKDVAMETGETLSKEEAPSADSSIEDILDYARKHPEQVSTE